MARRKVVIALAEERMQFVPYGSTLEFDDLILGTEVN